MSSLLGTGAPGWSQGYGDPSEQTADGVAIDVAGNVLVVGNFAGTIDLGCGELTAVAGGDLFVAKLSPDGTCIWSKGFGASGSTQAASVAVDASGSVVVAGSFSGTLPVASNELVSAGAESVVVLKLDANGVPLWSEGFGDGQSQATSIAIDATGNVIVLGSVQGSIAFGNGTAPIDEASAGLFLAKLDPNGAAIWSKGFANIGGTSVAVDGSGDALFAGVFEGSVDLGGCTLASAGQEDGFVAKFDTLGACVWSKDLGAAAASGLATDGSGDAIVAGTFSGTVTLGANTFTSAGGAANLFVAKLDPTGNYVWSKGFPGANTYGTSTAVDTAGNVFITGALDGAVNLGGGTLTSAGGDDVMLASFDADGNYRWAKRFGNPQQEEGLAIAVDPTCHVVIAGQFQGTFDFGGNPITSAGGHDAFVAQFER